MIKIQFFKMKPKWDGSYIGQILRKDIILKDNNSIGHIYLLNFGNSEVWCYAKKVDNDFLCFYDQIKPYFGLRKHGTNMIKICNILYIIVKYIRLKKFRKYDDKYKKDIKKILLYKNIFDLSSSFKDVYLTDKNKLIILNINKLEISADMFKIRLVNILFKKHLELEEFLFKSMLNKIFLSQDELIDYITFISKESCSKMENKTYHEDIIIQNLISYYNRLN